MLPVPLVRSNFEAAFRFFFWGDELIGEECGEEGGKRAEEGERGGALGEDLGDFFREKKRGERSHFFSSFSSFSSSSSFSSRSVPCFSWRGIEGGGIRGMAIEEDMEEVVIDGGGVYVEVVSDFPFFLLFESD